MEGYQLGIWGMFIMLLIACVLVYLAIVKKFEPNLLLSIAFGMFIINIPGAYSVLYGTIGYTFTDTGTNAILAQGTLKDLCATFNVLYDPTSAETLNSSLGNLITAVNTHFSSTALGDIVYTSGVIADKGLFYYLYKGVDWVIFPPLIFLGIGAMTDFGPLIANPKSLLLGAAAQLGIFLTFFGALFFGFNEQASAAIAIIGGADGPTAIYLTQKMANSVIGTMFQGKTMDLLPAIAIAAYSYMALVPVIQPPIMKLLTTKKERLIRMEQLRPVSKKEKIIFPIVVTAVVGIILPAALPLLGMLMLGNLIKESGVVPRLSNTAQNELINIITIFLGVVVGTKAFAPIFLSLSTLGIVVLGVVAFSFGTAGGVLLGKLMSKLSKGKLNPLIGAAGVSAVPMAARVAQDVGRKEDPNNYLLMHAMGPNVAGVIGSAVAAGVLLAMFG
ncbi:MAG: sodium ion-translocating decarboxylase subunit beta [Clostridia bacterium]|nr:sodium ion-translocating decarboxylase subunit beta [Clostridia bacterium]